MLGKVTNVFELLEVIEAVKEGSVIKGGGTAPQGLKCPFHDLRIKNEMVVSDTSK